MSSESGKKLVVVFAAVLFAVVLIATGHQASGWHSTTYTNEIKHMDGFPNTIQITSPADFSFGIDARGGITADTLSANTVAASDTVSAGRVSVDGAVITGGGGSLTINAPVKFQEICFGTECRSSWTGTYGLDEDNDGYWSEVSSYKINDDYKLIDDLLGPGDCAKTDPLAHPGQQSYISSRTVNYLADESGLPWDFNCDGVETKQYTNVVPDFDAWCIAHPNQGTNPGECSFNPIIGTGPVFEANIPSCGASQPANMYGKVSSTDFSGSGGSFCVFSLEVDEAQCSYRTGSDEETTYVQGCR